MKNEKKLVLTSLLDNTLVTTLFKNKKNFEPEALMKLLNKSQIKKIKSFINNYFQLILNNSANSYSKKIITEWRKTLEVKLFFDIYKEIRYDPIIKIIKEEKNKKESVSLMDQAISSAIYKLFFYSDLTLGTLIGSIEYFNIHIKKAGKFVHSISNHNKVLYNEIWIKIEELNKIGSRKHNSRASHWVAKRHPENEEDFENPIRLYKRFSKVMKENEIKSLIEYQNFLSTDR